MIDDGWNDPWNVKSEEYQDTSKIKVGTKRKTDWDDESPTNDNDKPSW